MLAVGHSRRRRRHGRRDRPDRRPWVHPPVVRLLLLGLPLLILPPWSEAHVQARDLPGTPPPGPARSESVEPAATPASPPCPIATAQAPLPGLASPVLQAAAVPADARREDYRHRLASTPLGWPHLQHWCVWIEPIGIDPLDRPWQERWSIAVERALQQWQRHLTITRVSDAAAAHVRLQRRRPPLIEGPDRRLRASHGRATLKLLQVERNGIVRLEPSVEVLISPGQRQDAIEATALHELGHAFGLWGHSQDPADAMAAVPTARPVLQLSNRDRATLRWLRSQPTPIGAPLPR